ncbi:hypothetical protein OROGR_026920 [Orobanche gracilis]
MVGFFSRFSVRSSHRRSQSARDLRDVLPPSFEVATGSNLASLASATTHGVEIAVEFKPVQRPTEPLDNDQPIQCPLPEPSILNDGRIWKERVSSGVQRQDHTPVFTGSVSRKPRFPNRVILPSVSAPEPNILKLLDECNASGV